MSKTFVFYIKNSSSKQHTVTAGMNFGIFQISCDCKKWESGILCRHCRMVLAEDAEKVSGSAENLAAAAKLYKKSELEKSVNYADQLEKEVKTFKNEYKKLKNKLRKMIQNIVLNNDSQLLHDLPEYETEFYLSFCRLEESLNRKKLADGKVALLLNRKF